MKQMNKLFKLSFFAFLFSGIQIFTFAQSTTKNGSDDDALKGWHLKDLDNDKLYGISLEQAYNFLKEKKLKSKTVIVAVIDSGIDTLHEDLKPVLWKNPKEIPGNGKDDDNDLDYESDYAYEQICYDYGNASGNNDCEDDEDDAGTACICDVD